eukprot:COSAG06_NODE_10681_length_1637_cov_1.297139_2_plen_67_part_00
MDRLHRVAVGPLQLVPPSLGNDAAAAAAAEGAGACTDADGGALLSVALREGEVRAATETELRAIAR